MFFERKRRAGYARKVEKRVIEELRSHRHRSMREEMGEMAMSEMQRDGRIRGGAIPAMQFATMMLFSQCGYK